MDYTLTVEIFHDGEQLRENAPALLLRRLFGEPAAEGPPVHVFLHDARPYGGILLPGEHIRQRRVRQADGEFILPFEHIKALGAVGCLKHETLPRLFGEVEPPLPEGGHNGIMAVVQAGSHLPERFTYRL